MSDEEKIEKKEDLEEQEVNAEGTDSADEELGEIEFDTDEWGEEEDEEELVEEEVPAFVDNGDGTVSDTRRNLVWKKTDSYSEFGYGINWYEAHDYIESLNEKKFAGHDDWRLASFDDAKTLFSFAKSNRDKDGAEIHIDPAFEPNGGFNIWTYDEKPDYSQYALKFSYVTGNDMWEHKDNEYSHVRAVRDDIKDDWEPEWRDQSKKFER